MPRSVKYGRHNLEVRFWETCSWGYIKYGRHTFQAGQQFITVQLQSIILVLNWILSEYCEAFRHSINYSMKHFYYGHLYERVTDYYSRFPKWPYFKENENVKCNQTPCSSDSTNEKILHHVLNTLFRLHHSYTIISNIFCHTQVLYEKAVLNSFKNSQETHMQEPFK